jgi:hypothetical protein
MLKEISGLIARIILVHNENGPPADWQFMIAMSWISASDEGRPSRDSVINDLKQRAKAFGEPFCSILQSVPADAGAWHNHLSFWPTQPWDDRNGTVTLVGDAAHPMTFRKCTCLPCPASLGSLLYICGYRPWPGPQQRHTRCRLSRPAACCTPFKVD